MIIRFVLTDAAGAERLIEHEGPNTGPLPVPVLAAIAEAASVRVEVET